MPEVTVNIFNDDGELIGTEVIELPEVEVAPPTPEQIVQAQAEQALAGMVIAISEDPNVSVTTRAWAIAWRQTVGI